VNRQRTTPNRAARRRSTPEQTGRRTLPAKRLRLLIFAAIAVVAGIAALGLVVSRLTPPTPTDATAVQIRASMGGFDPASFTVKPGQVVRVEFSSTDTSMHSDGGGWHELAIDALGIDWKVGPESSKVFEFTAPTAPGTYAWYCDICCGGKANPSMQGKLTVAA
jgi:cytochrome c oxidase subunit II